jgi:flagellar motor protein MotB
MSDSQHVEETPEDENYFVSMTDMMVGMLFIFIIMLMMFALNFRKGDDASERIRKCLSEVVAQNAALSEQINAKIASVQKDIQEPLNALELTADQRERLLNDLQEKLKAEGITEVGVTDNNTVLRLTEGAVRFDPDKFDLDAKAQDNVARIARALSPLIAQYSACKASDQTSTCADHKGATLETVFIEGHTDTTGSPNLLERDRKNWLLSTDRATATYRAIVAVAPELTTFRNRRDEQILSVSGYSSTRPIVTGDDKLAWAQNRRIDLRFTMDAETRFGKKEIEAIRDFNDDIKKLVAQIAANSREGVDKCK